MNSILKVYFILTLTFLYSCKLGNEKIANHLLNETSPYYLLQHVNEHVDWCPWGPEDFKKA